MSTSETDWKRLNEMPDDEIDTTDIPVLGKRFFANARLRLPDGKVPVLISLDEEIAEWFQEQDGDLRINLTNILTEYANTHR